MGEISLGWKVYDEHYLVSSSRRGVEEKHLREMDDNTYTSERSVSLIMPYCPGLLYFARGGGGAKSD